MKAARIIGIMTVIGFISGGLLAWVFAVANPLIIKHRQEATRAAVKAVLPGAKTVKKVSRDGSTIYVGSDAKGAPVGNAFEVEGTGFQGKIKMMVGMDSSFNKMLGLKILDNVETPGLGARITEGPFQEQFKGLSGASEIVLLKNQAPDKLKNQVEAITGATISSRAVVAGLNDDIAKVRKVWAKGGSR